MHHQRLNQRLLGCTDWTSFNGHSTVHSILNGQGNVDDNFLALPEGDYRAASIRSFNSTTRKWSIWWLDMRNPSHLDVPVVGQFENGIGIFYADDLLDGKPIKVRFKWDTGDLKKPRWEQAFSNDNGKTWETNWIMLFSRKGI